MTNLEFFLLILAIFGGIDLAWRGVSVLATVFPALLSAQARLWRATSDTFAIAAFKRKAVATRIEEVLNQSAYILHPYLPKGWLHRAKITWVRSGQEAFLKDGDIILRIRPEVEEDHSLMQALWVYFQRALFPETQTVLPQSTLSAIALAVSRAALEKSHPYLLNSFDKVFLTDLTKDKAEVLKTFSDCVRLNDYGLLMGPYLRELDQAAQRLRMIVERQQVALTADAILSHMLSFQPMLRLPIKPDDEWAFLAEGASYALLLVSRPPDVRPAVEAYVKRAQEHVRRGVARIYVIGRYEERDFVRIVIKALLSIRELKGTEMFALFRDYRGDEGGVGALLSVDDLIAKLGLIPREIDVLQAKMEAAPTAASQLVDATTAVSTTDEDDELAQLAKLAESLIVQLSDYDRAWISLAEFGGSLRKQLPDFTPKRYGGSNLYSVLKKLSFLEFDERGAGSAKAVYVRAKHDASSLGRMAPEPQFNKAIWSQVEETIRANAGVDGWIFLGNLGHFLKLRVPGFAFEQHGAGTFHEFISSIPSLEVQERGDGHSKTYVRLRP